MQLYACVHVSVHGRTHYIAIELSNHRIRCLSIAERVVLKMSMYAMLHPLIISSTSSHRRSMQLCMHARDHCTSLLLMSCAALKRIVCNVCFICHTYSNRLIRSMRCLGYTHTCVVDPPLSWFFLLCVYLCCLSMCATNTCVWRSRQAEFMPSTLRALHLYNTCADDRRTQFLNTLLHGTCAAYPHAIWLKFCRHV